MNAAGRGGGSERRIWLWAALFRLFHGQTPQIIAALGVIAALAAGVFFLWQRFGPQVLNDEQYRISIDDLEVTPQPPWIRSAVKAEVMRDGQLSSLVLTDAEATVKIARAFEGHTWVAHVERVTKKAPGHVRVDLHYRRPVAMVVVSDGYWPVDTNGVLLPPTDFSPSQTGDYLQILGATPQPAGPAGTAYGDRRVEGGAAIATLLDTKWRELNLHKIVARPDPVRYSEPEFDLFTRRGVRLLWGHAPGRERPGEPPASDKVVRLLEHVEQHGPLDRPNGSAELDLRNLSGEAIPRTANLREPGSRDH